MSRPWRNREALLLGHSQMEGMAPHFVERLRRSRARTVYQHIERGLSLRTLQRDLQLGRRQVLAPEVADELPFAIVALSGNGPPVTAARDLQSNIYWLRAEFPQALIAWLGHTITDTGTAADEQRARAAELEARLVPSTLPGFIHVDMRVPDAPLAADGLHFTRAGYRQMADHAWAQILEATDTSSAVRSFASSLLWGMAIGLTAAAGYHAYQRFRARDDEAGEGAPWR